MDSSTIHPLAPEHLPSYIVAADGSDHLFTFMTMFTVALILGIGILYMTLHAMPERMAHASNHSQMQVIGILALLALFTHNNMFWVIAILVAAFRPPDVMTPLNSISQSLSAMAGRLTTPVEPVARSIREPSISDPETPDSVTNPEGRADA